MSRADDPRGTAPERTARRRRQRKHRRERYDFALEAHERMAGILTTLRDLLGASLMLSAADTLEPRVMVDRAVRMLEAELAVREAHAEQVERAEAGEAPATSTSGPTSTTPATEGGPLPFCSVCRVGKVVGGRCANCGGVGTAEPEPSNTRGKPEAMTTELETELRAALDTINIEAQIALEGGKASWETVYEQSDRSADHEGGS